MLTALDKASMGRPVMLRDDSLHNRWVNSRALEILGINAESPDPAGGSYVRDAEGPVGLLLGQPSTGAELAVRQGIGSADWANTTTIQSELRKAVAWSRGRALGGSSSINAMMFARGHRSSYDAWEAAGGKG
jgi:hypothetical protein